VSGLLGRDSPSYAQSAHLSHTIPPGHILNPTWVDHLPRRPATTDLMNRGWANALRRYDEARRRAYTATDAELAPMKRDARVGMIGLYAMDAWRSSMWAPTVDESGRYGDWPWDELKAKYDTPGRFELAVWTGSQLAGLAIGSGVSSGHRHVTMNYVEASSIRNPMSGKILQVADLALMAYALEIGVRIVRVDSPAEGLLTRYATLGYLPPAGTVGLPRYAEKVIYTL
jgi:hypothetical protein